MSKIKLTYEQQTKAPNLLYHSVMTLMQEVSSVSASGLTVENLAKCIAQEADIVMIDAPALRKQLKITTPEAHPRTPNRRYINLIWDNEDRVIQLAQITCVEEKGGDDAA